MKEGATPANEEFYTLWHVSRIRLINQEESDGLAEPARVGEWEMHTTIYSEGVMEMNMLCVCVCVFVRIILKWTLKK